MKRQPRDIDDMAYLQIRDRARGSELVPLNKRRHIPAATLLEGRKDAR